jgi:hypothetical protein
MHSSRETTIQPATVSKVAESLTDGQTAIRWTQPGEQLRTQMPKCRDTLAARVPKGATTQNSQSYIINMLIATYHIIANLCALSVAVVNCRRRV